MNKEPRFQFGKNWQNYVRSVDEYRLNEAANDLSQLVGIRSFNGLSFLDAGCGSGIVSLAAKKLGAARIHSYDYDQASVNATATLGAEHLSDESWTVEQGSLTDDDYLDGLGQFDVVYSWGVIHHTGAMWQVAESLPRLVKPGGLLVVAIYNDQGLLSDAWRLVKRIYVAVPAPLKFLMAGSYFGFHAVASNIKSLMRTGKLRTIRPRGMSLWHDAVDWVGGYPFEDSTREEMIKFYEERRFKTENLISVGSKQGCNQFVFRLPIEPA